MYAGTDLLFVSRSEDVVADFKALVDDWAEWSKASERVKRIDFALQNTYRQQIGRIESHINQVAGDKK
jgi:hypothetical protein